MRLLNIQFGILIVRPHKRISEIPRLLLEQGIRHIIAHGTQVLYGENRDGPCVALSERMNLPEPRNERREMFRKRILGKSAVTEFLFLCKIIRKRLFHHERRRIVDRITVQHPFSLRKFHIANLSGMGEHILEKPAVQSDIIFRRKTESRRIYRLIDSARNLVRLFSVLWLIMPLLCFVVGINDLPHLHLGYLALDVALRGVEQQVGDLQAVNILQANGGSPPVSPLALVRLSGNKIFVKVVHCMISLQPRNVTRNLLEGNVVFLKLRIIQKTDVGINDISLCLGLELPEKCAV